MLPPPTGTTAHHSNLCARTDPRGQLELLRTDPRGQLELLLGHAAYCRGWVLRSCFVFGRPKVGSKARMPAIFTGSAAFLNHSIQTLG